MQVRGRVRLGVKVRPGVRVRVRVRPGMLAPTPYPGYPP